MSEESKISALLKSKKFWSNLFFYGFIVLLLIPATRMPIQSTIIRLFSFGPQIEEAADSMLDDEAYELYLMDENGERRSLKEFKGKNVFLNHWATWCPPCVGEMPSIQELYTDMSGEMAFILMSSESIDKLKAFKERKGYNFPVYQIISQLPDAFSKGNSIPATFIIGSSGELILEERGAKNWNSKSFKKSLKSSLNQT